MDVIQKKIEEFNSQQEKDNLLEQKINYQKTIVKQIEELLKTEKFSQDFNKNIINEFEKIIGEHNVYIKDVNQKLNQFIEVIEIRLESGFDDIEFGDVLESFRRTALSSIEILENVFKEYLNKINLRKNNEKENSDIDKLKNLKQILSGQNNEYITEDMLAALFEQIDILNLPEEEANEIINQIYNTKLFTKNETIENLEEIDSNDSMEGPIEIDTTEEIPNVTKEDVFEILDTYIKNDSFKKISKRYVTNHEKETLKNIKIEEAKKILEYFIEKNLIEHFDVTALMKVITYSNEQTVKETYEKIKSYAESEKKNFDEYILTFCKDKPSSVWIKTAAKKSSNQKTIRKRNYPETTEKYPEYNPNSGVTFEEMLQNSQLLDTYKYMLLDKYDKEDYGQHLSTLTTPPEILRKNIELCKTFNLAGISKIPLTCISYQDIESKIHEAIELGLLHPPMSQEFLTIEDSIEKSNDFQANLIKEKNFDFQSIRQYFQRNQSRIESTTTLQYALLSARLHELGFAQFYDKYFFSNKMAGRSNHSRLEADYKNVDEEILKQFTILNNDEYEDAIFRADEQYSKDLEINKNSKYTIEEEVISEPLIKFLEENYRVSERIDRTNPTAESKNEYLYYIEGQLLSRYKILRLAQIFKNKYGTVNGDMLLYAITYNSFIPNQKFNKIEKIIQDYERSVENGISKTI